MLGLGNAGRTDGGADGLGVAQSKPGRASGDHCQAPGGGGKLCRKKREGGDPHIRSARRLEKTHSSARPEKTPCVCVSFSGSVF